MWVRIIEQRVRGNEHCLDTKRRDQVEEKGSEIKEQVLS